MNDVARSAKTADRILKHVEQRGVDVRVLSPGDCAQLQQRWRAVFAARLHAQTGSWTLHRFDWHVFSYGYYTALEGHLAADAYRKVGTCDHVLLSSYLDEWFGFECTGAPCDLTGLYRDVTVAARDLTWTMCFTHEPDCGPYFARCD